VNPRERFKTAVNHQEPDRVPIDFGRHVGSIHREAYLKLQDYLKEPALRNQDRILDRMAQNIVLDESLLERFAVDFRWLTPNWIGVKELSKDSYQDMWGIVWHFTGEMYSLVHSPLREATRTDLEKYPWPDPHHPALFKGLKEQAKALFEHTNYVIGADSIKGGILTTALQIRGYEQLLMDLVMDPEFAETLLDRILSIYQEMWTEYLKEVGSYVQIVYFTDDIGTQSSMMISPKTFRALIKPRLKRVIDHIKGIADVRFMYHTDGAILPVIEDLIEIGVDILNPVQTSVQGLDRTDLLKEKYGDRICFHGAIDVQQILPKGTPETLRSEVTKRIRDLGKGGGYVLAPCHNIGHDVPPENVVALFEAAQELGRYPL
jgi:uroporphyrinogen decarboxylase